MCSNLSNHQLKINCYKPRLIYMKHMIATNQKSMRDVQKNKEKGIQTEHYRKSSTYKITEQENWWSAGEGGGRQPQKQCVNRLNAPTKDTG